MSAYVRLVYMSVFLTTAVACAPRASHVVASGLARERYAEPASNAYDTDEWAASRAERDEKLKKNIARIKADLLAKSHFEFFPPENEWFPSGINPGDWQARDREMIRLHLRDILVRTEKRRAYYDDSELERDARRGQTILNWFTRYESRKGK